MLNDAAASFCVKAVTAAADLGRPAAAFIAITAVSGGAGAAAPARAAGLMNCARMLSALSSLVSSCAATAVAGVAEAAAAAVPAAIAVEEAPVAEPGGIKGVADVGSGSRPIELLMPSPDLGTGGTTGT